MIPVRKAIPTIEKSLGSTVAVTDGGGNLVQTTGYYPSGTPYKLPSDAGTDVDAVTEKLHIGNKWIGHKGFDLYDNTARMHDPLLARFHSVDPLFGNYPGSSPWTHCLANPLSYVDPDGRDNYFNLKGELVHSTPDNDNTYLVLSKIKENVLEKIDKKHYIPLPSEKEVEYMSEMYNITERKGLESGYTKFSNGDMTQIIIGTEKGVEIKSTDMPTFNEEGIVRNYNVHTHTFLQSKMKGRNDLTSGVDETDMKTSSYVYPNIILGYGQNLEERGNRMGLEDVYSHPRSVAFYDKNSTEGTAIEQVTWDTFKKTILRIHKSIKSQSLGK